MVIGISRGFHNLLDIMLRGRSSERLHDEQKGETVQGQPSPHHDEQRGVETP
jgi:hypothetical protein